MNARREGRSLSNLAREMIQAGIEQRKHRFEKDTHRQMQVIQKARQVREAILEEHGGDLTDLRINDLIASLREERDEQILRRSD